MEVSSIGFSVEELDRLLNELEQIAQSQPSRTKFYGVLLERLRFVLSADGSAFVVPFDGKRWGVVATAGKTDFPGLLEHWVGSAVINPTAGSANQLPEARSQLSGHSRLLSAFVSRQQPSRGAILVELSSQPDVASRQEISRLCQAFAEIICIRQSADMEEFLNAKQPAFQQMLSEVSSAHSLEETATLIVNNLIPVLGADRISLVQRSYLLGDRLLAVSGSVTVEQRSESSLAVKSIGTQVIDSSKPISKLKAGTSPVIHHPAQADNVSSQSSASDSGELLANNYISFPLGKSSSGSPLPTDSALVVEWNEHEELLQAASLLNSVVPTLGVVWQDQIRWLRTPRFARVLSKAPVSSDFFQRSRGRIRLAMAALLLAAVAWAVTRPYDLRIEMEGVLEPESQRTIYASQDGVVTQVMVGDSHTVTQGQLLVVMRSPTLELQIEEVLGELKANTEKRDGLSLNINQLARDNTATPSTLNRLSSEVRQLETMTSTLETKLAALRKEESGLKIESPIDGIVVARDLDKLLDSRPLRRGDALFRIVDPNAPWRLQLSIADSDVGYVKNQLFGDSKIGGGTVPQDSQCQIDFVLASRPDHPFRAEIVWISDSARNPRGNGVTLDAIAAIAPDSVVDAYVGATAHAFMVCGQRPVWFVFSRPLVESIQRKLWF